MTQPGQSTLAEIERRMSKLGDLPIFSASLNRVRRISSDADSDAMSLAVEVMKDANLTTKLLQLANSPFYNRGMGRITSVSRTVVLLGFETIRNLCLTLKLIDSFHTENPDIDMNAMLVNAFLTAGMAREVAERAGVRDVEQSYVCGLLHGLGEIIVAYALPETYALINEEKQRAEQSWSAIQQHHLGTTFYQVGQLMAESWEFSPSVVKTMQPYTRKDNTTLREPGAINHALAALSYDSMDILYGRSADSGRGLGEVYQQLADAVGVDRDEIEQSMQQTFRTSCELASDYGLDLKRLMPPVRDSDDALLSRLSRQLAFHAGTRSGTADEDEGAQSAQQAAGKDNSEKSNATAETSVVTQTAKKPRAGEATEKKAVAEQTKTTRPVPREPDVQRQLATLQAITQLLSSGAGVHHVFTKVLEGLHAGIGFDRAVLCLLDANHSRMSVRLGEGDGLDALKDYFDMSTRDSSNLFIQVLRQGSELCVDDINDSSWRDTLPAEYRQTVGAESFMIGALRAGDKPVGLFYADNGLSAAPVSVTAQQGFIQFISQARLALQYAELHRSGRA